MQLLPAMPALTRILRGQGYDVLDDGRLNVMVVINPQSVPNVFDDDLVVWWADQRDENGPSRWHARRYDCTAEPGTPWLRDPMNRQGAGIVAEGQHMHCWAVGLHRGRDALVQVGPMRVHRDDNRDDVPDRTAPVVVAGVGSQFRLHDMAGTTPKRVGRWSAGCIVSHGAPGVVAQARQRLDIQPTLSPIFTIGVPS